MQTAIGCSAILAFLLFGLGFLVSLTRARHQRSIGHSDDPADPLHKMVRAHGNTAEYVPALIALYLYLGMQEPATWVIWVIGLTTVSRVLIVIGMVAGATLNEPHPLRFIGALGTYLGGLTLTAATLLTLA